MTQVMHAAALLARMAREIERVKYAKGRERLYGGTSSAAMFRRANHCGRWIETRQLLIEE